MLLDFGCGAGGFLLRAKALTANSHGVEPESRLKSHFDDCRLTVFHSISDIPGSIREEGYDIITLFHVLEHLSNPKSVLIELSKILADKGQIIIEVPNANDALLTFYKNKEFSNFTYWSCHLFLYTPKTLKMLFMETGLKINYIKQVQRYPLSNHSYWLIRGKPGGHKKWSFLNSVIIQSIYEKILSAFGKCDTLIASISRY